MSCGCGPRGNKTKMQFGLMWRNPGEAPEWPAVLDPQYDQYSGSTGRPGTKCGFHPQIHCSGPSSAHVWMTTPIRIRGGIWNWWMDTWIAVMDKTHVTSTVVPGLIVKAGTRPGSGPSPPLIFLCTVRERQEDPDFGLCWCQDPQDLVLRFAPPPPSHPCPEPVCERKTLKH